MELKTFEFNNKPAIVLEVCPYENELIEVVKSYYDSKIFFFAFVKKSNKWFSSSVSNFDKLRIVVYDNEPKTIGFFSVDDDKIVNWMVERRR